MSLEENMEEILNISAEPVSEPIKPKPPEVSRDDREKDYQYTCLLYTSPSPRDLSTSRMPSSA